ncbi:MAG: DUF454 domain-containing protein [Gemmatimonadetes bacterium]|nr:MAG: DUF454 domain-containing protein [Gemmatimonadota bacterium]
MTLLKKTLLQLIGTLFLVIGIAGIVLPLVPTTVPLLVACACYVRSSERLYNWLMNHRLLGKFIRDYHLHRAMPFRAKISAIVLLWATILLSVFLFDLLWLRLLLLAIAVGVTIFLSMFVKTLPKTYPTKMDSTPCEVESI